MRLKAYNLIKFSIFILFSQANDGDEIAMGIKLFVISLFYFWLSTDPNSFWIFYFLLAQMKCLNVNLIQPHWSPAVVIYFCNCKLAIVNCKKIEIDLTRFM